MEKLPSEAIQMKQAGQASFSKHILKSRAFRLQVETESKVLNVKMLLHEQQ